MNTDKGNETKELSSVIPENIRKKIWESGAGEEHFQQVYRVAKWGKLEEKAFVSTYEEILQGWIPDRYSKEEVGTYSTSVYTSRKNCDKFINCLKRSVRLRKEYPHPVLLTGNTSHGLVQRTAERVSDNSDSTHIDWWIFEGAIKKAVRNFRICEESD
ncbi:hypothetical protein C805_03172 [Eubacterium sp. 14-2]|uniref:hypothetical protein n=1 Tax=Eubacterium sp. 14-2 TaxID=1235790 RepID=UPI00033531BE|nr:hypothetical protein [Eubacterium sp. 14-2]EOT23508.1 hypothetical protein C805_03172 [Eubacterium sp. 14-2]